MQKMVKTGKNIEINKQQAIRAYCPKIYTVPKGHITLSADVIGPIFPDDQPVQLESMFPTGHGRFGKGNFT